jgi:hypothetical protein
MKRYKLSKAPSIVCTNLSVFSNVPAVIHYSAHVNFLYQERDRKNDSINAVDTSIYGLPSENHTPMAYIVESNPNGRLCRGNDSEKIRSLENV